jgi:predicted nucleic acid-binding protein
MKTFLLDTNLLILLIVGQASPAYIGKHKRLRDFSASDFNLLMSLLNQASSIRFTPNTLTETSNLLNQTNEPMRSVLFRKFRDIVDKFDETYIESRLGAQQTEFVRLGLTDAVLILLSIDTSLILLTTDLGLYLAATERGLNVVNFNQHREANSS